MPNSPQAKYEVRRMKEILDEVLDHDGIFINLDELALDLWRVTKEVRPVAPRT